MPYDKPCPFQCIFSNTAYIEHAFKHNVQLKEGFLSYIAQRPHIHSLMYVPINCAIIVELFKELKGTPPQTLTELYTLLTSTLLERHEKTHEQKTKGKISLAHSG